MSSVVISGDTSGAITLQAPAVAGSTTLTLPTTTGTVVVANGAQTIEFADGSASAPSITNSGDTNTGMFFPAADTIAFAEGGVEAMRLDASGNVGINTSSPSSLAKLDVNGDIKYTKFQRLSFNGRQKTWKISQYPKSFTSADNSEMFVINIYDSTDYDQASYKSLIINRAGGISVVGIYGGTSPYNVEIKTYDDGTDIHVYVVADNYCDYYTVDIAYNRIATTITKTDMGSNTYTPSGTKVGDTTGQTMKLLATYSQTVGATNRDLYIDNAGGIGYISSTRNSKTNIENLSDTSWLYQLNPVSFNYRKKDDGNYTNEIDGDIQYGLIAEDVEPVRKDLCFYDESEDGQILRGIQYSKLVVPMLKAIQELKSIVDEQAEKIKALEAR